ncbi:hypothetical protein [uncultured Aquimarina sp.]|uniref:hypothetical protein n=1 Tax=uncultured Aquimarina sp. TaxID=575652 RepID=UPI0026098EB8|nr:hypothetical protein [uncultured Aquimarina sp.]
MSIKTKEELKSYFETGDKPTQEQYEDLLDTIFDVSSESIKKVSKVIIDLSGEVNTIDQSFRMLDVIPAPGENKMILVDAIKTFVKPIEGYTVNDLFGFSLTCDYSNQEISDQGIATVLYGFDLQDNGVLINKRSAEPGNNFDIAVDSGFINSGIQIKYAANPSDNPPSAIDGKCKISLLVEYTLVDLS